MTWHTGEEPSRPAKCPNCGEQVELLPIARGKLAMVDVGLPHRGAWHQRSAGRHLCGKRDRAGRRYEPEGATS